MTNRRERIGVAADELAFALRHELVDLAVGQAPHELLVLLQPLRGELAHDQVPVVAVRRRVHRRDLVTERELVAVLIDQFADVGPTRQRHGETREGPGHGVARREGVGVVVDRACLVVPGDHVDVLLRLAAYRALGAEPVEVGIRVVDQLVAAEEVDGVVVGDGLGHVFPLGDGWSVTNVAARW